MNGRVKRIDDELAKVVEEVAKKNRISERLASRLMARQFRKINGRKFKDEITF